MLKLYNSEISRTTFCEIIIALNTRKQARGELECFLKVRISMQESIFDSTSENMM